tara:strand:+ start:237 stop:455 length:219 start_codon:yes stop_codon:yes gene_type:complete
MELPINQRDLKTIVNALSLGGDARLYHLLKDRMVKEEYQMDGDLLTGEFHPDSTQFFSESDDYQCKHGECDI